MPASLPFTKRFYDKVKINEDTGCHEWTAAVVGGPMGTKKNSGEWYGAFHFGGKVVRAHRFAWLMEKGEIPKGKVILHKCDNPCCVNVEHLRMGTQKDNVADMIAKGRKNPARGEACSKSKLVSEQVYEIRALEGKMSARAIGRKYGIDHKSVRKIQTRQSWSHLKD